MATGIDPKVDYAFKRVFGSEENREILLNLLNAVLMTSESQPLNDIEILNPFSHKETLDDRLAILDIKAIDDQGHEFLIEMQMLAHQSFRERLLFYLAKDYAQQLREGESWEHLRPVIVICFINDVLCPEMTGYHGRYQLLDVETQTQFSEHWTIHVFELPKFHKSVTELNTDLERWNYFLQHGDELDPDNLPLTLQSPSFRQATGVLQKMSLNTLERDQYEARLRFQRDEHSRLVTALCKDRRNLIVRIGTKRLGTPPADALSQLNGINDLDRLSELLDRVLDCTTWESLLSGSSR